MSQPGGPTPPTGGRDQQTQVADLLQRGISAARAGDRPAARAFLEQVVALDSQNEKGWFWLAAAVDSVEEKRVCLENVLAVNPNNERAQRLLKQIERQGEEPASATEPVPGVAPAPAKPITEPPPLPRPTSRRPQPAVLVAGTLAALTLVAIVILLVAGGGGDEGSGGPTSVAGAGDANVTEEPGAVPIGDASPTEEAAHEADVTIEPPTPISDGALPPTWTPRPTLTIASDVVSTLYPPAPPTMAGELLARSGYVLGDTRNQPIVVLKPDGSQRQIVSPENARGHAPVFSPDGTQYAFVMYMPGTRDEVLQVGSLQSLELRPASAYWANSPPIYFQDMPAWTPDGQWLVFVGQGAGSGTPDLYRVRLSNPAGDTEALEQLTADAAVESWPAAAPDNTRIAFVSAISTAQAGANTELRIVDVTTRTVTNLTSNGASLIEDAPDWSPNGQRIVFQAHTADSPQTDIYWLAGSGIGAAEKIVDWPDSDEIQPRFSPDGRYIAFSSNRTGNWDIFLYEIATKTFFQVTNSPDTDIANDWTGTLLVAPAPTPMGAPAG